MIEIRVGANDKGQRLDRFLRKYYPKASLSHIYKLIRKDIKLNGKRAKEGTMLNLGDVLTVYIDEEQSIELMDASGKCDGTKKAKRQFKIAYEDEDVIIVEKPFGLLTHGDGREKKNTLVNQVVDYLIETGEYIPRQEKTFRPASIGRLDRNTTGLVMFGKTAEAQRDYSRMMRKQGCIEKYYETIVIGRVEGRLRLEGLMLKDEMRNRVRIAEGDEVEEAKSMKTLVEAVDNTVANAQEQFSLVMVQLLTGRTHQIRMHLASEGHPIIGDAKYGDKNVNKAMKERFNLTNQLLHCRELRFNEGKLADKNVVAKRPKKFDDIAREIFG